MPPKQAETNQSKNDNQKINSLINLKFSIALNVILIVAVSYLLNIVLSKHEKIYADCSDYFRSGIRVDGIYEVNPSRKENAGFNVYCNMTAGGWTAIMRRDLSLKKLDFNHDMATYKKGFGDLLKEHFLGLDHISLLTNVKDRQLMMIVNENQYRVNNFKVLNEFYYYKLVVMEEIDKIPDGTSFLRLNNTLFSASDVDFDLAANSSCSAGYKCGWWFTDCYDHSICMTGMSMHSRVGVKKFTYSSMLIK